MRSIKRRNRRWAFSLVETLVVIVIIAIMAGLIVGAAFKAYKAALNLKATVGSK
jgi:type II secretory pathway pseudopilin PulG